MNDQTPGIGHNTGEEAELTEFDKLQERCTDLEEAVDRFNAKHEEVTDQATADKTSEFLEQIRLHIKAVDDQRVIDKAPSLEEGRAIDKKFKTLPKTLATLVPGVKAKLQKFFDAEKARIAEEQRVAAEKERKAQEAAAEATRQAEAANNSAAIKEAEEAQARADEAAKAVRDAEAAKPQAKGSMSSRSTGLRKTKSAVIDDYEKALAHYAEKPAMKAFVQDLADADARAIPMTSAKEGMDVCPGVTMKITESV